MANRRPPLHLELKPPHIYPRPGIRWHPIPVRLLPATVVEIIGREPQAVAATWVPRRIVLAGQARAPGQERVDDLLFPALAALLVDRLHERTQGAVPQAEGLVPAGDQRVAIVERQPLGRAGLGDPLELDDRAAHMNARSDSFQWAKRCSITFTISASRTPRAPITMTTAKT